MIIGNASEKLELEPDEKGCLKKRKYDSDDSKRRLLKAAIDVFAKLGFDAATTRKIAKRAGVNDSLIHRYFQNKLGLFVAVMHDFHQHFASAPPYPACDSVEDEIINFFRFRVEFFRSQKKFAKMVITRAILDPKVRQEFSLLHRNGLPGLIQRLEKLKVEGKIRDDINLERLIALLGGVSFSVNMFTGVISELSESMGDEILVTASKVIADGLAPKK